MPAAGCISSARITDAIASTNQPNATRNTSASTRAVSRAPTRLPSTAAAVTIAAIFQSTPSAVTWPASPTSAFIAMTGSEVPTATGIARPASSASAGTTTNPPPAPMIPVSRPTAAPRAKALPVGVRRGGGAGVVGVRPLSIATAEAIIIAANPINRTDPGRRCPIMPPM